MNQFFFFIFEAFHKNKNKFYISSYFTILQFYKQKLNLIWCWRIIVIFNELFWFWFCCIIRFCLCFLTIRRRSWCGWLFTLLFATLKFFKYLLHYNFRLKLFYRYNWPLLILIFLYPKLIAICDAIENIL